MWISITPAAYQAPTSRFVPKGRVSGQGKPVHEKSRLHRSAPIGLALAETELDVADLDLVTGFKEVGADDVTVDRCAVC